MKKWAEVRLTVNYELLANDIRRWLAENNWTGLELSECLGTSYMIGQLIAINSKYGKSQDLLLKNFLAICDVLEKSPTRYITSVDIGNCWQEA